MYLMLTEKISEGEKNVLTAKDPYQLGVTSGTSGKSSLLPTTNDIPRIFFTNGVLVGINTMFEAYPGVRNQSDAWGVKQIKSQVYGTKEICGIGNPYKKRKSMGSETIQIPVIGNKSYS